MKNTRMYLMITLVLVISTCSQNENRRMWQPSYSSIGVEPNDDAPVKSGAESSLNFAQEKTLTIAHGQSMAYLKFFIPGFSRLDSAILRMQTKEIQSAGQVDVHQVMDIDWDETQLRWNQRPEIGETALLSLMIDKPEVIYEFDLTEHVASKLSNGNYYICLCVKAASKGTRVSFASVEDYQNLKPRFMVSGLTYVPPPPPAYAPDTFAHPGILLTQKQFRFVRAMIQSGRSPWKEAFDAALNSEFADVNYKPKPVKKLTRTGYYKRAVSTGYAELSNDAKAAFLNAQLWALTDSSRYADKAIEIINAWSTTCKEISGGNDKLTGGTVGIQLANAAEILRHTSSGWLQQDQEVFEKWMRSLFWPLLRDFIPSYNGNWDAIIGQALISLGIFLEDDFIFDHAVNYYLNGIGNGRMTYYVREDSTTQETLRDQGHEQMGVGALAGFAESAWNQGLDLYSTADNRLLKGVEGTAKRVLETEHRRLMIWESMYNHYHNRMGHEMPHTEAILNMPGYRPEGYGRYRGFSTLFFYGLDEN